MTQTGGASSARGGSAKEAASFIDCEPLGDALASDRDGNRFFEGVRVNELEIRRFDCVKVILEEEDGAGDLFAYGQVLAVFDEAFGEGVFVEVRWFMKPREVIAMRKKRVVPLSNELVEGVSIDDVPAGSVAELIEVASPGVQEGGAPTFASSIASSLPWKARQSRFVCRFYDNGSSNGTLIPVSAVGRNNRGESLSEYAKHYGSSSDDLHDPMNGDESENLSSNGRGIYANAIQRLHVSVLPEVLPCRTVEKDKILTYLRSGLSRGGNIRPLYISGMPGTGKTACLLAAIKTLQEERRLRASGALITDPSKTSATDGSISSTNVEPNFEFIEINCLRLHTPYEAYSMLWKGLSGERVSPKTALQRLSDRFQNVHKRSDDTISIVLLDELDFLVSGNESVVYNFFDWPQLPKSSMIVVGIANTMDLPERLTLRARSRLGGDQANRMVFQPYSHEQVKEILTARLVNLGVFSDKSLELLARRAVNVAGDLRAALKICQRAIELHVELLAKVKMQGTDPTLPPSASVPGVFVSVETVSKAVAEYRQNPLMIRTTKACALEKGILIAMCKHSKISGSLEMGLEDVWARLNDFVEAERNRMSTATAADALLTPADRALRAMEEPEVELEMPPYHVFEELVSRMCEHGLLVKRLPKSYLRSGLAATGSCLLYDCMFSTRLQPSDIAVALKGDKSLHFL